MILWDRFDPFGLDWSIIARMKRLALSVVGGFLLPLLYSIIVGLLTAYITNNRTLDFLALMPIRWPVLLLYQSRVIPFERELSLLLYIVICNVIFYGTLIYFVQFALSKRKKTTRLPAPPNF